ncbi:MAG TPA: class I SAM-dependent methyltransferase [Gemmataceae bacterium]|jgi:methyltransferase-like protein/2-polyprenyl-3-methyl-5-hydroxy-6-metoxy-1,4-benzoquinol methylase
MPANALTSYDLIPYPDYCLPQTHPDRLAVLAAILGLEPPPIEQCRVLELGCAAGSNLIAMAEELPQSTFLGIDVAQTQIDEGQKAIDELGLSNIELRHQSIRDFEPGSEMFDYILCHGVYSWVPPDLQAHILAISRHCLQPNGVAYVSYNTLPGWHMRGMIRDMMLYHGRRFRDPRQQIAQARGLLDFLVSSVNTEQNPYGQFLRSELESLRQSPDAYLYHEHLEEHNSPIYFHQFVEQAAAHQLRYLADANLYTMDLQDFPQQVSQVLQRVCNDRIQLEQYVDFLRNRTFRQTLLCHAHHTPNYRLDPGILTPFYFGSSLQPVSARLDLHSSIREDFRSSSGSSAFSSYPIVKAVLVALGEAWPQYLSFEEVCSQARAKLDGVALSNAATSAADKKQAGQALLKFYMIARNVVDIRLRPLRVTKQPGLKPLARRLARWQVLSGRLATNLRHEFVYLDDFGREALPLLDGGHTRPEMVRELVRLVRDGRLTVQDDGRKITDPRRIGQAVVQLLDAQIDRFAQEALLQA